MLSPEMSGDKVLLLATCIACSGCGVAGVALALLAPFLSLVFKDRSVGRFGVDLDWNAVGTADGLGGVPLLCGGIAAPLLFTPQGYVVPCRCRRDFPLQGDAPGPVASGMEASRSFPYHQPSLSLCFPTLSASFVRRGMTTSTLHIGTARPKWVAGRRISCAHLQKMLQPQGCTPHRNQPIHEQCGRA